MIYKSTQYTENPPAVMLEQLPDGTTNVWLTKDAQAKVQQAMDAQQDGEEPQQATLYEADAAFCNTQDAVTADEIGADFDGWWEYAAAWTPQQEVPTVEQRLTDAEAAIVALMGF